ncbi:ionotropic receptor 21a-like [Amphibalanus amphitrite]|uniref:ionotropic receptor 21a-like n=1 Tax=Amphibalanus amphitrite TaxID=1232801 RepID=UPI001C90186D|nr:ionotropic receptor 21a-like [Amphibalanus amphitrite]
MLLKAADGSTIHDGLESRLVLAFASVLNFVVNFSTPSDGGMWGGRAADGTWNGLLGDLHHDRADIGMANLFRSADKLRGIDMTVPYMTDYACFLAAVPEPPPHYLALVRPLSWRAWIATIFAFVASVPVLWALSGTADRRFKSFTYTAFYGFGVLMQEAMEAVPRLRRAQLFLGQFWVLAMVVAYAYRANLVAYLSAPAPAVPLDTTHQLLASGLTWGVRAGGGWEAWFQDSPDPVARRLADGMQFVRSFSEGVERSRRSRFAFINSKQSLQYLVVTDFTDSRGIESMHVSRECYIPFSVALGLPKYSPLTGKLNQMIQRAIQAGLVDKMFDDVLAGVQRRQGCRAAESQGHTDALSLNLSHMQAPLSLLVLGLIASSVAFMVELLLGRLRPVRGCKEKTMWATPVATSLPPLRRDVGSKNGIKDTRRSLSSQPSTSQGNSCDGDTKTENTTL